VAEGVDEAEVGQGAGDQGDVGGQVGGPMVTPG
jgi:hypothetical protein